MNYHVKYLGQRSLLSEHTDTHTAHRLHDPDHKVVDRKTHVCGVDSIDIAMQVNTIYHIRIRQRKVSSIADERARRAASRQTCCKQRWTFSVINLQPNCAGNTCNGRRFRVIASYLSKVATFDPLQLHLAPLLGMTPFEFCRDLRRQKTRAHVLSLGVVCVILCLAFLAEHRLMTDRQTGTLRHTPR